ncbi:hypothetical protein [Persicobacter psychrovividus]|uniref:Endo-acting ulvan lyase C-terminal domain-containing protein n=1 Tax=Persicobacter psychrovividus TaxID=387638 RepID=A0ABM7VM29_9BACT|nr:hypothetical protein PEPS_43240 [Persicobacter psychrovividus]
MKNYILFVLSIFFSMACQPTDKMHPSIYVKDADHESVVEKIEQQPWAKKSYQNIQNEILPYVDRHIKDPNWITSRLSMYWKQGERYTQCYLNKHQDWDYGEGNAPVPTVRFPGMRRWNNYKNVPLESRTPYNETGDMLGIDRSGKNAEVKLIPYKETGHMIRYNNLEILELAEKSAFLYWVTQEEKYATFAADIYWTWMLGTYYMEPMLDPNKSTKGPGGYEPGGILGYYDVEQIHDNTQVSAAVIYDFLYDFLQAHPHPHLKKLNKSVVEASGVVFKRYIDLGLIRGGKLGNWNVNGFKNILNSMLVLESNDFYPDGKGKEYYIPYYTEHTTEYHEALPDIMKIWDKETGLWPESPGYASGMIPTVFDMGMKLYTNGINTMDDNPMILKAVLANLNWLDARGNLVVFGDMRGGPFSYEVFEDVLTYFTKEGKAKEANELASIIKKGIELGQYDRNSTNWKGICLYEPLANLDAELPYKRTAFSKRHRHIIQKNGNDIDNAMMFTLYGGDHGSHLSKNGLAMQIYAKGWAVSPKASAYESYWSKDFGYFSGATGSNTILPGYTHGEISVNGIDPAVGDNGFYNTTVTSENCSFADISADEKRRLVAMVRTSESSGYYVDIFRSDLNDNDYLYHNLGNKLEVFNTEQKPLSKRKGFALGDQYNKAYDYFKDPEKADWNSDFIARWTIDTASVDLVTDLWMLGQQNRAVFTVNAPPTTLLGTITPAGVNRSPQTTPTLIVRQQKNNAKQHPFVSVFETYNKGNAQIANVEAIEKDKASLTALEVDSKNGLKQFIISSTNDEQHLVGGQANFKGTFAISSFKGENFDYLYLGKGKMLSHHGYRIESADGSDISAALNYKNGKYQYSSDKEVLISIKNSEAKRYPAGYNREL